MKKTLQQLRDERDALESRLQEINDALKGEDGEIRSMTDEERTEWNEKFARAETLDTEIADRERIVMLEKRLADKGSDDARPEPADDPSSRRLGGGSPETPRVEHVRRGYIPGFGEGGDANQAAYESGMFARALWLGASPDLPERKYLEDRGFRFRKAGTDQRAMSSTTATAGGVLVPDSLNAALIDLREERGVARRLCEVAPMSEASVNWPRTTGDLTHYYVGESTAPTESEPTLDSVNLTARIVASLTRVPESLLDDSVIDLGAFLARKGAYALANAEDQAWINGDGTSTYGGIVGLTKLNDGNHDGSVYTAATGNTAFSTLDLADFEGAMGQLPEYAAVEPDVGWLISRVGYYAAMVRLANAAGGNTKDSIEGGNGLQFLGYPVYISQVMNAVTTAETSTTKCYFGSPSQACLLGDRRMITMKVLNERYADTLEVGYLIHQRFDINVHEAGDGTNAGSMIALETAAS